MPEFLDLRGQCARSAGAGMRAVRHMPGDGEQEAGPVDGRIPARTTLIQQMPVLDAQERRGQQRRDVGCIAENPARKAGPVKRRAAAIEQGQAGYRFLPIHGVARGIDPGAQPVRGTGLQHHIPAARFECSDEAGHAGIAQALVIRSLRREPDLAARTRPGHAAHTFHQRRQEHGGQYGTLHLGEQDGSQRKRGRRCRQQRVGARAYVRNRTQAVPAAQQQAHRESERGPRRLLPPQVSGLGQHGFCRHNPAPQHRPPVRHPCLHRFPVLHLTAAPPKRSGGECGLRTPT